MKLIVSVLATAAVVSAQEYSTIQDVITGIKNVTEATTATGEAVRNLETLTDAIALNGASTASQQAINITVASAQRLPPGQLPPQDSFSLIGPIQALSEASNATLTAFIEKKPFFVENNITSIVYQGLSQQNYTSGQLSAAIAERGDPNLAEQSARLSGPIQNALRAALAAYAPDSTCEDVASCRAAAGVDDSMTTSAGVRSISGVSLAAIVIAAVASMM